MIVINGLLLRETSSKIRIDDIKTTIENKLEFLFSKHKEIICIGKIFASSKELNIAELFIRKLREHNVTLYLALNEQDAKMSKLESILIETNTIKSITDLDNIELIEKDFQELKEDKIYINDNFLLLEETKPLIISYQTEVQPLYEDNKVKITPFLRINKKSSKSAPMAFDLETKKFFEIEHIKDIFKEDIINIDNKKIDTNVGREFLSIMSNDASKDSPAEKINKELSLLINKYDLDEDEIEILGSITKEVISKYDF